MHAIRIIQSEDGGVGGVVSSEKVLQECGVLGEWVSGYAQPQLTIFCQNWGIWDILLKILASLVLVNVLGWSG